MLELLQNWLVNHGLSASSASYISASIAFSVVLIISLIINTIVKRYLITTIAYAIKKSKTDWDNILLHRKTLKRFAPLAPAMVIYTLTPIALHSFETITLLIINVMLIYMTIIVVLILNSLLNVAEDIYQTFDAAKEIPIKGFMQVLKLILYFLSAVLIVSILLGKTPIYLLSSVGALAAVMMLVFKDSILGFVAGIQLAANKMVSVGDWIEMPKYGADGDVLEVALTTVKVQNWDKTITTIPTYALISESFKNWRGMTEAGGRRIKRSINIDINSIQFCNEDMLNRYQKIHHIAGYINDKKQELHNFNQTNDVDNSSLANGRRMTNVGTFRAYILAYVENHPMINKNMTCLVRQLAPTRHGLPIEIYVFSKDKVWINYEAIQGDIFDHILAIAPEFDLKVYQYPAGTDFYTGK